MTPSEIKVGRFSFKRSAASGTSFVCRGIGAVVVTGMNGWKATRGNDDVVDDAGEPRVFASPVDACEAAAQKWGEAS